MTPELLAVERPYLLGVAYRLLGSAADAEDMVQEALSRAIAIEDARSPRALLTTIVTRLCLDELRSARRRRRVYPGPWLPEPVLTDPALEGGDGPGGAPEASPEERISTSESVSMGFLLLLESLSPAERAVLVLREVFELEFAEIAAAVGRTEVSCRQLLHRARTKVVQGRRRLPSGEAQQALAQRFFAALATGDVPAMIELLVKDAAAVTDHGGKASANRRTIVGAERIARFFAGLAAKAGALGITVAPAWVNGAPALLAHLDGRIESVTVLELAEVNGAPRIVRLHTIRNPDKLGTALRAL